MDRFHTVTRIIASALLALALFAGLPAAVSAAQAPAPDADTIYTEAGEAVAVTDAPEDLSISSGDLQAAYKSRSDFALKRLLVFTDAALTDSFGAADLTYYDFAREYVLDYATEEDTANAYDALVREYGSENVVIDSVFKGLAASDTDGTGGTDGTGCTDGTVGTNASEPAGTDRITGTDGTGSEEDPPQTSGAAFGDAFSQTPELSVSWGTDAMEMDTVRDRTEANGSLTDTVIIAVLDSGIYTDHELFRGRLTNDGYSAIKDEAYDTDVSTHGTHVAGIVADSTPSQVKILPIKILDGDGYGSYSALIAGINYANYHGADVINLSLSVNFDDYAYQTDADYIQTEAALERAETNGVLNIAAAGNENGDTGVLNSYPAISSHAIAISSIRQNRTRASSSNYGEAVDFAAPGYSIRSAGTTGVSDYVSKGGTSMAAPHASAAFGMLRLYNPDASHEQLIGLMKSISEDLGSAGKDIYFGNGLPVFTGGKVPLITDGTDPGDDPPAQTTSDDTDENAGAQNAAAERAAAEKAAAEKAAAERAAAEKAAAERAAAGKAAAERAAAQKAYAAKVKTAKAKKVTSFKAKAVKGRKAKLSWKASGVTGYQVRYAPNRKFKKARTKTLKKKKVTIKKLKAGKTYYVKVRPFTQIKTPAGKTVKIYGKWSKAKKVKVKK